MTMTMTMKSFSAIFRAFTKDSENAVDQKIKAIEKQLSVITKLHAKDMKEMKALIESVSKASVENLKVDNSIKEEIKEIKEEDKKELAFMIANVEKELNDARDELEKLQSTPKLGEETVGPGLGGGVQWGDEPHAEVTGTVPFLPLTLTPEVTSPPPTPDHVIWNPPIPA